MELNLDRGTIGLDESVRLSITINCDQKTNMPRPKLPPLSQFDVQGSGSATNLQIINGEISYSLTYNYSLRPKRVGTFPIHKSWLVFDGQRYESNATSLKVVKSAAIAAGQAGREATGSSGKAKDLFLTAELDKKTAYVDEQVTLLVKFYRAIRLLSTPDYTPPQTADFWPHDITPQKRYSQILNGREYAVTEIRRALFPTKPGNLKISEARVTATVPDKRGSNQNRTSLWGNIFQQGRNITIRSKPLSIDVKPLPKEGKRADFSGGVGSYKILATIDKNEVEVNEGLTLRVKISGRGNVKSIPEPKLPQLPDFRVEKSSSDFSLNFVDNKMGGSKYFEYLLIPRLPGAQKIKAVTLNYFDPNLKRYQTASSRPINLMVNKGELAENNDVPYNMVSGQTLNLTETDIRFIKPGTGTLHEMGDILLFSPVAATTLAIPILAMIGGLIDIRRRQHLAGNVAYARMRKARKEAAKRLKTAESYLSQNEVSSFYGELSAAVYQLLGDKLNLSAQGLTTDRVREELTRQSVATELIEQTIKVINLADFGRFAGGAAQSDDHSEQLSQARDLIMKLAEALR